MRSYTAEEVEACCHSFELNSEAAQQDFVVNSCKRQRTSIELKPGGSDIDVTPDSLEEYHITISTRTCTVSVGVFICLSRQCGPLAHHTVYCPPKYSPPRVLKWTVQTSGGT